MNKDDKALLVKDLCARMPYAVEVEFANGFRGVLHNIDVIHLYNDDDETDSVDDYFATIDFFGDSDEFSIEDFKPCLFPLSSMTEEQREELYKMGWYLDEDKIYTCFRNYDDANYKTHTDCLELINWCYENHLDINGLIPKDLAIISYVKQEKNNHYKFKTSQFQTNGGE